MAGGQGISITLVFHSFDFLLRVARRDFYQDLLSHSLSTRLIRLQSVG